MPSTNRRRIFTATAKDAFKTVADVAGAVVAAPTAIPSYKCAVLLAAKTNATVAAGCNFISKMLSLMFWTGGATAGAAVSVVSAPAAGLFSVATRKAAKGGKLQAAIGAINAVRMPEAAAKHFMQDLRPLAEGVLHRQKSIVQTYRGKCTKLELSIKDDDREVFGYSAVGATDIGLFDGGQLRADIKRWENKFSDMKDGEYAAVKALVDKAAAANYAPKCFATQSLSNFALHERFKKFKSLSRSDRQPIKSLYMYMSSLLTAYVSSSKNIGKAYHNALVDAIAPKEARLQAAPARQRV